MCWWLILKPLVQKLIKFLLNKQKEKMHHIIQEVQKFIPDMRNIFITCWRNSSGVEGSKRILFFFKIVMMNVLYSK
jgi:hypothetical protein